jgi:hypothetical protein
MNINKNISERVGASIFFALFILVLFLIYKLSN